MKNDIIVKLNVIDGNKVIADTQKLNDITACFLQKLGYLANFEIDLKLTSNSEIIKYNHKYMGKNAPTDVLSFPIFDKFELQNISNIKNNNFLLGEIVISTEFAEKEAKEKNIPLDKTIEKLFCHGLKHLTGIHHK